MGHDKIRMARQWKHLSASEVQAIVEGSDPTEYATGGLANGDYMPVFSQKLVGRSISLQFDELELQYRFLDIHELEWTCDGETHRDYYQGHEPETGIFFVHHYLSGSKPAQARTLIVDINRGLVTLCAAQIGNECEAREVCHQFHFGVVEGNETTGQQRHHFTSELVGKAIRWSYRKEFPPIKHIYTCEYYYTYVMEVGDHCWVASNPADYIKINDHLYLFSFLEERQAGTQGLFLINTDTLYDVGCFFGINSDNRFECYTVGARGEWSTMASRLDQA